MKKLKWHLADFAVIRTTLFGYATLIVSAILIVLYGRSTIDSLDTHYQIEIERQHALQNAEVGLKRLRQIEAIPAFQRIQQGINQKTPPKLSWVEFIDRLRQEDSVSNLRFELAPQQPMPISTEIEPILSAHFYETPVTMTAEIDHESTLLKLLDHLSEIPLAATVLDGCDIVRRSSAPKESLGSPHRRLSTTCRMRFVYLISSQ